MYVRVHRGADSTATPIVLFHGGAQTGHFYEHAPDGGPGFAQLLAARGRTTCVVDLPGIGRSRYHEPTDGPLTHYSAELIELIFTATAVHGHWPGAPLHTQWPGSGRRGDPIFDAFYATQVGRLSDEAATEQSVRAAGAALVDHIGPCFLLSHSQAGPPVWHIADARPSVVRGIVAVEPKGPPYFDAGSDPSAGTPPRPFGLTATPLTFDPPLEPDASSLPYMLVAPEPDERPPHETTVRAEPERTLAALVDVPVLLLTGQASYHDTYDHRTVRFLRTAGVETDHVRLGEHGIHGNGHLLTLEDNRADIADLVETWLAAHDR